MLIQDGNQFFNSNYIRIFYSHDIYSFMFPCIFPFLSLRRYAVFERNFLLL